MNRLPQITVSLPARNAEATLSEALQSIQNQCIKNLEIILVDHRSEDATHGIMRRAARDDSRIRVFQCHGTFVEAANAAWEEGSAPYVARMDSDDVAHPQRLEKQLELMQQNPSLSACGTLVNIVKRNPQGSSAPPSPPDDGYQRYQEWINSLVTPEDIRTQRFIDSPIANPTAFVKREAMVALDGFHDPDWAEDYDFWLRMLESDHKIGKVNQSLLDWYDAPERSTRTIARYEIPRLQAAKAHFLARIPSIRDRGVILCGAGPIGKEMAKLLTALGIQIHAFIEVNQRQIGNRIHEIPVLEDKKLGNFKGKAIALSAVGLAGAREKIRALALKCQFIEGADFFCVA